MNNKLVLKLIPLILNTVCGYSFAESIILFIACHYNYHKSHTVENLVFLSINKNKTIYSITATLVYIHLEASMLSDSWDSIIAYQFWVDSGGLWKSAKSGSRREMCLRHVSSTSDSSASCTWQYNAQQSDLTEPSSLINNQTPTCIGINSCFLCCVFLPKRLALSQNLVS